MIHIFKKITNYHECVKCACCGSTNVDILFEQSFFKVRVMRCNNCDHNFTTITSKEKINELYSKSFWNLKFKKDMMDEYNIDTKPKKFKKLWDILIPLIGANKSQAHSHYTYLKSHVIGKSLLEIGSGEGYVFLSYSHSQKDLKKTLEVAEKSFKIVKTGYITKVNEKNDR
tara:strand:- start:319 stop:831 length:513 start_codon:yes stop_codon:yes gene_type:complete